MTTDGQSASLSWNKTPTWGLRSEFCYYQTVAGLLMWGVLSDERTGLSFTIASGPRQRSHFLVRVHDHILLSQIRDFLFVASYDSQGYGGGIRTHFKQWIASKLYIQPSSYLRGNILHLRYKDQPVNAV
jgi:hypothetical protein